MPRILDFSDGHVSQSEPTILDNNPTVFTIANNQSAATDVTGLSVDGLVYDVAYIRYSIKRTDDVPTNKWETGQFVILFIDGNWEYEEVYLNGNEAGVQFSVTTSTNTAQVQYTSTNFTGGSYVGEMNFTLERFPV